MVLAIGGYNKIIFGTDQTMQILHYRTGLFQIAFPADQPAEKCPFGFFCGILKEHALQYVSDPVSAAEIPEIFLKPVIICKNIVPF